MDALNQLTFFDQIEFGHKMDKAKQFDLWNFSFTFPESETLLTIDGIWKRWWHSGRLKQCQALWPIINSDRVLAAKHLLSCNRKLCLFLLLPVQGLLDEYRRPKRPSYDAVKAIFKGHWAWHSCHPFHTAFNVGTVFSSRMFNLATLLSNAALHTSYEFIGKDLPSRCSFPALQEKNNSCDIKTSSLCVAVRCCV